MLSNLTIDIIGGFAISVLLLIWMRVVMKGDRRERSFKQGDNVLVEGTELGTVTEVDEEGRIWVQMQATGETQQDSLPHLWFTEHSLELQGPSRSYSRQSR